MGEAPPQDRAILDDLLNGSRYGFQRSDNLPFRADPQENLIFGKIGEGIADQRIATREWGSPGSRTRDVPKTKSCVFGLEAIKVCPGTGTGFPWK